MKAITRLFLVTTVVFLAACFVGCTEKASSGTADSRKMLLANENIELKAQLQEKDKEIAKQKALLAECQNEKAAIQKQLDAKKYEDNQKLMEGLLKTMEREKNTEE